MKTIEIDCFEVLVSYGDGIDDFRVYYVSDETLAKEMVKGSSYSSYAKIQQTITILNSFEEIEEFTNKLRQSAISRLPSVEHKAIGV